MAVSTYFTKKLFKTRFELFIKSIKGLQESNFPGPIYLVDDGSDVTEHLEYAEALFRGCGDERLMVVRRETNGGVSRTKNTCIRVLLEAEAQFCFLADDDVDYRDKNWALRYIETMVTCGVGHLSVLSRDLYPWVFDECLYEDLGGGLGSVLVHNGFMLTFTPEVIGQFGYFDIFPGPMGHEHVHWTTKILGVGVVLDRLDSDLLVGVYGVDGLGSTRGAEFDVDNAKHMELSAKILEQGLRAECVE